MRVVLISSNSSPESEQTYFPECGTVPFLNEKASRRNEELCSDCVRPLKRKLVSGQTIYSNSDCFLKCIVGISALYSSSNI